MTRNATLNATINWLALLCLTGISYTLAERGLAGRALLWPVLAVILIKSRIVIDRFMGLQGSGRWRAIVLTWLFLLVGLIAYSFTLSYPAT